MPRENVEIIRRGYEAFARGELASIFDDVAPDVVTYTAPPLPDAGEHRGYEGMLEWIAEWTAEFDEFALEAEELVEVGDGHVIARVRQRATGAGSGVPV